MGRVSQGVIGIKLDSDDVVIGMESIIANSKSTLLAITENGFGKRTDLDEYRVQIRGGKGVITYKITPKTGNIVGIRIVDENDDDGICILLVLQIVGMVKNVDYNDYDVLQIVLNVRTVDGGGDGDDDCVFQIH